MAAYVTYDCGQRRVPRGLIVLAGVTLLGIAACGKLGLGGQQDEMTWARAALERNPRVEVVAADQQTSTFTVRLKDTGELRMIRADQMVGGPPGIAEGAQPAGEAGATAGGAGTAAPVSSASAAPDANSPAGLSTSPSSNTLATRDEPATAAATNSLPRELKSAAPTDGEQATHDDVSSTTPGGRVLASGPGYAIKAASKGASVSARVEREKSATTNSVMERRHDPIICQGDRLLQIDNRNIAFDGDAVTAEDGCEIHITNSHISAKGVGVFARHANVHIENSQIEGDSASIDVSEGAQVYASSSKFKGMSRRLDNSSFHDLGGNVWN